MYTPKKEMPPWLAKRLRHSQSRPLIAQRRLQLIPRIRHAGALEKKKPVLRVALLTLMSIVLFVGTAAGLLLIDLSSAISKSTVNVEAFEKKKDDTPPTDNYSGRAVNIMVLGIDLRTGSGNEQFGVYEGALLNDTNLLMHISADRSRMEVVSIPRDTLVDFPSCLLANGVDSYPQRGQLNWGFGIGMQGNDPTATEINLAPGVACVKRTMEKLTGIDIDEFVVVDFGGFQSIVNSLGGIEMCLAEDLYDPLASLNLKAGCQKLDGFNALAYARTRHLPSDPSGDIGRMGRQQEVIGRILATAKQQNLLTDFPKLYSFTKEGIKAVKVSRNLSALSTSVGLAYSLSSLPNSGVQFATMPWVSAPTDPNRVIPSETASLVWESLRNDKPLPDGIEVRDLDGKTFIKGELSKPLTPENTTENPETTPESQN